MRKYQNHSPNRLSVKRLYVKNEGMKVALIGDEKYENRGEIKDLIFKLKQKFGDHLTIISRGNKMGIEKWVRKFCIELDVKYLEYNLASTPMNLYSGMSEEYYDKPHHPTQKLHQYDLIAQNADKLCILVKLILKSGNTLKKECIGTIKKLHLYNKKTTYTKELRYGITTTKATKSRPQ
jgi:hypothetical protein